MDNYLKETKYLNFRDPKFDQFVQPISRSLTKKELAVDLYFLVRDAFLYDPYHLDISEKGLIGSNVCLLYTSPSPRDRQKSRMPSSA